MSNTADRNEALLMAALHGHISILDLMLRGYNLRVPKSALPSIMAKEQWHVIEWLSRDMSRIANHHVPLRRLYFLDDLSRVGCADLRERIADTMESLFPEDFLNDFTNSISEALEID
ncbi:MAG: hypothetical protein EOP45_16590 [Sphingobacteriaceae bacterium]|nr:MAG: hypothetical protein EOP45_16590 [Sphingobacteriaceae bacterium]